ncbi:MAG TPA: acyl carrier protein [Drouetiella sp.]
MGLDSVELIMAVEEEFGVDIPNETAAEMTTVGSIYDWLKDKLKDSNPAVCLSQTIFYQLRTALQKNYGLSRNRLLPDTRLSDLLPATAVEEGWPFLQRFMSLRTPPCKVAHEFLGIRLSNETLTIRELVGALIQLNRDGLVPQWYSDEDIWSRLVRVFVRQLNVNAREVRPWASLTRDLGVD